MSISAIQGPGLLFVRSRISPTSKNILDEPTFLKWYDDEHIAEVVSTSGIQSAFRYVDVGKSSPTGDFQNLKPFLAVYPMRDLAFTLSDEFKKINVKSTNLPGSGIIYDLADMDVSYLGFLGATPRKDGDGVGKLSLTVAKSDNTDTEAEHARYILSSGVRPEKEAGIDSIQSFYEQVPFSLLVLTYFNQRLHKLIFSASKYPFSLNPHTSFVHCATSSSTQEQTPNRVLSRVYQLQMKRTLSRLPG